MAHDMRPLSSNQNESIARALDGMRTAYNQFDVEPCNFTGIPSDLSALDYIPYELPMSDEYAAGSISFSVAWGNVLTTSFGFSWMATRECDHPQMFALKHEHPSVLIFPYFRLLEITESSGGCQDSPAEFLWFDTIRYFNHCSYIPDGWHPVYDAVHSPKKLRCPNSVTKACQRLIDLDPEFYYTMSTYPYCWAHERKWDELRDYAEQLSDSHRLSNR